MATRRIANNNNDDNNQVAIDISGAEELLQEVADHGLPASPRQLARSILWFASCTLATVFYGIIHKLQPPPIFEGNEVSYHLTLFFVFLVGVAEIYAAILLSSSAGRGGRTWWAKPLLCASVVVLILAVIVKLISHLI